MDCLEAFSLGLKPDEDITFLDWANKYFYLPRESSSEYGRYRSSRTPMIEEILVELSPNSDTQEVVVMKPTQLAGTTAAIIFILASADIAPGPGMCIQPTGNLARSFSKKKLQTSINATIKGSGKLKGKISEQSGKDGSNTILEKTFPGGSWRIDGSNSPAVYRSESVRYIILDDFDGFEADIGGEGDPAELADRRTGSFSNRKIYKNSTPTVKGFSNIEKAYEKSSQGKWNVPCPYCGGYQFLNFSGIKFIRSEEDREEVIDCWYECEHCHKRIDEHQKEWMFSRGKYIHKYPERKIRGFHYNALYTPLGWINNWKKIAEIFLKSKSDPEKRKTWANTLLAESYEAEGVQPKWKTLFSRCEPYPPLKVPEGFYILTAGVDVQDNRLAVRVDAWGEGEENAAIYWVELFGDPGRDEVWEQLDQLIDRPFFAKHIGHDIYISSVGVDSGGHHTQRVYDYCRKRQPKVFALKGASVKNKPIIGRPSLQDVDFKGEKIKKGVQLWPVGTDTAKALIYNRLGLTEKGPGYCHFYIGLDEDFFQQLTAEKLTTRFVKGFPVQEWIKIGPRNEGLDCTVYSYAAALKIGIGRADWNKIKAVVERSGPVVPKPVKQSNENTKPVKRRRILSKGIV